MHDYFETVWGNSVEEKEILWENNKKIQVQPHSNNTNYSHGKKLVEYIQRWL